MAKISFGNTNKKYNEIVLFSKKRLEEYFFWFSKDK
jgi:hypothetical protein